MSYLYYYYNHIYYYRYELTDIPSFFFILLVVSLGYIENFQQTKFN